MWVFHSPGGSDTHPLFLYEYLGGRSEVLENIYLDIRDTRNRWLPAASSYAYEKVIGSRWPDVMLMQDGNSQIIKAVKKNTPLTPGQAVAAEAVKRIDAMYHLDNMYKESSAKRD